MSDSTIIYGNPTGTPTPIPEIPVVDKEYDPESANAQSGTAVAEAVAQIEIPSIPEVDKTYNPQSENPQSGKAVAEAISSIEVSGGGTVDIDQGYNPESRNAQSGIAVAEALKAQYGDVVSLITTPRKYDTEGWEKRGAKGYYTDWSNVSNRGNLKVGQIGLLPGLNITNNEPVILVGEIKEITEWMVWLESITWIQLTGCKGNKGEDGKDGKDGVDGTVSFDELTDAQRASLKGETGPRGPQGPQGPARDATYHRLRDTYVNFELQKGRVYTFTVDNSDENSAYIVDSEGDTISGVAGKTLEGMKSGFIICADRCSGMGIKSDNALNFLSSFVSDRWDWDDSYRDRYGPYYLRTNKSDGIDIWEI